MKKLYINRHFQRVSLNEQIFHLGSVFFVFLLTASLLSGCVMSEEMRRIEAVKKAQRERDLEGSTNLTGEQIFVRSCNTCHPNGRAGLGPTLEILPSKFPEDAALKAFIRKGKGMMPPQSVDRINDVELDSLIAYLRQLDFSK